MSIDPDPGQIYTIFDLEATSTDPATAEIIQIAALHPRKSAFMCFVETQNALSEDEKVWSITRIDISTYKANKQPLDVALRTFLNYIGDSPLAGHNIHRYDLPLLKRALESVGLELPATSEPAIDTQRWAQLRYPTPPTRLKGYSLGHLYQFFTGRNLEGAHQADKDCEANREVLHHLYCMVIRHLKKRWRFGLGSACTKPHGTRYHPLTRMGSKTFSELLHKSRG